MKDTDPFPYDVDDHVRAYTMEFVREAGNGDRYYTYPLRGNATAVHFAKPSDQEYFYRAMHRDEALGWLTVANTNFNDRTRTYSNIPAIMIDGHQGWASYRNYSLKYLSPKDGYRYLLEIHAPGFIEWLAEIGVNIGKAESGDISWGVGLKSSNGFQGNSQTNKTLHALYAKVINGGVPINHSAVKGGLKAMANAVTPYIFQQSIKWAKIVDLRSVPI